MLHHPGRITGRVLCPNPIIATTPPRPPIPLGTQLVCLVAASDGVWDNWMYGDVSAFFLDPARTAEVMETNSAEGVTEAFMQENARKANANFGSQVRGPCCRC